MRKKILAINWSTRINSSNFKIIKKIEELTYKNYEIIFYEDIEKIPHFNPDLDNKNPPELILKLRKQILNSDGIIICTPEYVYSIPSSLKNVIEWCVSTTLFSKKPVWLITASSSWDKAHEQLKLIMKTVEAKFNEDTTLLIKWVKAKFDSEWNLKDKETISKISNFINAFDEELN